MNTTILIDPQIEDFMKSNGFLMSDSIDVADKNSPCIVFDNSVVGVSRVTVKPGGSINCEMWNDEEDAPRFCSTLKVEKSNLGLMEWKMLMAASGVMQLGFFDLLNKN